MYKIRGRVKEITDPQTIETKKGEEFEINKFVIEDDTDFSNEYQFEIFGKSSMATFPKLEIDNYVNIEFYIKCRKWNDRYFTTLVPKHIVVEDGIKYKSDEDRKFSEKNDVPF